MRRKEIKFPVVVLALFLALISGCAPIMVAGAALGGYVWANHSLARTYDATPARTVTAVKRALVDLKVTIRNDETDALGGKIDARRADGEDVDIRIHKRENGTEVNIRVGAVGSRPAAEEIHKAIARHL